MAERSRLFSRPKLPAVPAVEAQRLAEQVRALVGNDLAIESVQLVRDQAREEL